MLDSQVVVNLLPELAISVDLVRRSTPLGERLKHVHKFLERLNASMKDARRFEVVISERDVLINPRAIKYRHGVLSRSMH